MKKKQTLSDFIHRLVKIEPTESPLISCFVSLDQPRANYFSEVELESSLAGKRLSGKRRDHYEEALSELREYLERSPLPTSKSVALYSRWGDDPLFLPMEFQVPMATEFIVDHLPHVYPLIQLKDTCRRFVTVVATESDARIMETTIGSVTEEILAERPEIRERVGREWTRQHYGNHKRERGNQFVREKVAIIDRLMSQRGINYLVLAGKPKVTNRLKRALPARLQSRIVSTINKSPKHGIDPILMESIVLIAEAENRESLDRVAMLEAAVLTGGLGVAGGEASLDAIQQGYADILLVDQNLDDEELREGLVRKATATGVTVDTVEGSETLKRLSGVGCLLRYRPTHPASSIGIGSRNSKAA